MLVVAHKGSIDTCTLQLRGKKKRPIPTFQRLMQSVPYCAVGVLEETPFRAWRFVQPPIPAFTSGGDQRKTYDWSIWL